jgi:hypothetical protein
MRRFEPSEQRTDHQSDGGDHAMHCYFGPYLRQFLDTGNAPHVGRIRAEPSRSGVDQLWNSEVCFDEECSDRDGRS